MCSMILKEAVSYYTHNGSNVYCTMFILLQKLLIGLNIVGFLSCFLIKVFHRLLSGSYLKCIHSRELRCVGVKLIQKVL
jgi:hypothetical protein